MKQLKKTLLTLVALLAVTTGAWADETPLLTINASIDFMSGSQTFDDKVTVTFSNFVYYGDEDGWYADESLLTVAGTNGYTITSCKFYTNSGDAVTGYTIEGESPSVYLSAGTVFTDANQSVEIGEPGIKKIEVFGTAPAASSTSGPEVAWTAASKTGTFTMPGGNVTLEPEYYPQAALAAAPTAINDVPATTDGAIVNAGTVANIGETTTAQGTVMYYVSPTALDDAALLALAADQWTADVPTAADLAQGQAYVYYYVRGNDSDTDAEIFSDGDILAANALTVTIAAEPTYAITFNAANANTIEAGKATVTVGGTEATVTDGKLQGVKMGSEVKLEAKPGYKFRKVEVKKKVAAEGHAFTSAKFGEIVGSDGKAYAAADKDNLPSGVTAVAMICYVSGSHGLALALTDEGYMDYSTAQTTCAAHTPAITGGTWKLATKDEWDKMISAAGSTTDLRNGFSSVGVTNMQTDVYWASTEYDSSYAYYYDFYGDYWNVAPKGNGFCVRACLAF